MGTREVLLLRPDVMAAEHRLAAAQANVKAARAAFFPRIALTTSIGTANTGLLDLVRASSWAILPTISIPLFDAGRNQANLEVAKASRGIAVAQYEKAIQTAFREVSDALAGEATLGEQARAQQAQIEAEQARLRLSELRYSNGVASYLDLLDAQRSLFTVEQSAVQVRLAQLQNQVALYKALGGGWSEASLGKQETTNR
jgi:multidrug efflux system outer membrane protein